ncbi:MAG TPA: sugar transferase [Gaiellaceae bacterium]|nr:sugar transferase [Gaiellaceae bacterium]
MATEKAPARTPAATRPRAADGGAATLGDIRSSRPYFLTAHPIGSVARRAASIAALIVLDLVGLTLGIYAALTVRDLVYGNGTPLWGVLWQAETDWLPFLTLVTVLVFWQAGLYAERERRAGFGRIVGSLALVGVITLIFALGTGHRFSTYGLVPTAIVLSSVCIGLLRGSYDILTGDLLKLVGVRRRAVLVGDGDSLERLRRALGRGRGGIDYEFIGAISSSSEAGGLAVLGQLSALPRVLATRDVNELIVTDSGFSDRQLVEIVEEAHRRGVKVRVAPRATELLVERRGEYVPGEGVPLFELRPPVFAGTDWLVKRSFDIVVSAAVAVLGLPLWLAIAAAIKLDSPGPVIYRDRRIGLNEQEFLMFKFRTMRADAPDRQAELEASNEAEGALFKIADDPRVTRVGRFLRRYSIDEIPQVLNVLGGEMSLVGPRPLPVRDFELLEPWHRKRYLVLPGMTGLWQIAGRSSLGFDDLVRLDFYYLEKWSIWLDISILLKTLPAIIASRGAY